MTRSYGHEPSVDLADAWPEDLAECQEMCERIGLEVRRVLSGKAARLSLALRKAA